MDRNSLAAVRSSPLMRHIAIAVAGLIAILAVLPPPAAAVPCEPSPYGTTLLSLEAPERIAFGREGAARVVWEGQSYDNPSRVSDVRVTLSDAQGSVVASHLVTPDELAALSAVNPWDRRPLAIPIPAQDRETRMSVRLTYTAPPPLYPNEEPCEVVQDQTVRWFAGVAPRFTLAAYSDFAELASRESCEELAPGAASFTVRRGARKVELDFCGTSIQRRRLPGLRLWSFTGAGGETSYVILRAVGWRAWVRDYRVDAAWRGVNTFRRWLRVEMDYAGRRVYRDREPGAFRDICLGKPRGTGVPTRRDAKGRLYCREPGDPTAHLRVFRERPPTPS